MNSDDYYKRKNWLDSHGFCHKCGKEKCAPNRKHCLNCLEIIREQNKKRYDCQKAKGYAPRRRELYHQKKSAGICVRCKRPATHGMYCYEHSIAQKRRNIKRAEDEKAKRHKRGLIPEIRKRNGLCYYCGQPLDNSKHGHACNKCAAEMSAHGQNGKIVAAKQITGWFKENKMKYEGKTSD